MEVSSVLGVSSPQVNSLSEKGYGYNAYLESIKNILGSKWKDELNSIWGATESTRDSKITHMLLCEILTVLRELRVKEFTQHPLVSGVGTDYNGKNPTSAILK